MQSDHITYLGRTTFRAKGIPFGIKHADRLSHMYVIGKTGVGKSTLLETMLFQDMQFGQGFCLIDPHGDLVERLYRSYEQHRKHWQSDRPYPKLIYLNVPDPKQPYGYNPLKRVPADKRVLAASGVLEVFKKMWASSWGSRMEHILRNALLALLDQPKATLPDLLRLLRDEEFRKSVVSNVRHEPVRRFWTKEFRGHADIISPIENKVGAFLADPLLYRMLTKPERPLSFRQIMDEGSILLVNLAKGKIGEDAAGLLGGLLVTTIGLAAFSRSDLLEHERRDFFLYIDEFQNYTTLALANMIAEMRKFHVGLVLAHQYLDQLDLGVRFAVLGNAGTIISFRLGPKDAPFLAEEFQSHSAEIEATDLLSLPNYQCYLKLMIDRQVSRPFSAATLQAHEIDGVRRARFLLTHRRKLKRKEWRSWEIH